MEDKLTLKQMILQEIEIRPKSFVAELVAISGYSSWNAFKKCLVEEKREFDKFQGILDVVQFIWKDEFEGLICQYSGEINPNRFNARCMLEWLSSNRCLDSLGSLLDRMKDCSNKSSREFAKIYMIQHFCQVNYPNIDMDEIIKEVKSIKTTIIELRVFSKLIKTYAYNQKGKFYMPRILAEEINMYFHEMESSYLKDMYQLRMCETMSYVELRVFNRPEISREYSEQMLNSKVGKAFKGYAYYQKGYSYLFSSYEKSLKYLNESIQIYKEMNRDWIVKDLDEKVELLQIYWGKLEKRECKYITNFFFMNVRNGTNISKLLPDYEKKIDEPMYLYLKGCDEKNHVTLIESALKFVKKGDSFLANLPKNELIRLNYENTHLLDLLQDIRVT